MRILLKYFITYLAIAYPFILIGQKTIDFNYFKRSGTVDMRLYVMIEGQKSELPFNDTVNLENRSDINQFIIEFSNLNIGLDKKSKQLKQARDKTDYYLYFLPDASSITNATESLKLEGISNEASLSDATTDKANKSVEIIYTYYNTGDKDKQSEIQFTFRIESYEGKRPLKPEDKGLTVVKLATIVHPNYKHLEAKSVLSMESDSYSSFIASDNMTMKNNIARQYVQKYNGLNEERTEEMILFLKNIDSILHPDDVEKLLFDKIIKFCLNEKEPQRCSDYCNDYQDLVYDDPEQYSGRYLEQAYFVRLQLLSNKPDGQWVEMCERFLEKFPTSSKVSLIKQYISDFERKLEEKKKEALPVYGGVRSPFGQSVENEVVEEEIDIEEDIQELSREDFAIIDEHEGNTGVTVRTGGYAKEGYVVEFIRTEDQSLSYNPSFLGNSYSIKLTEVEGVDLANGKYKINIYTKKNRQHLTSSLFTYNVTSVPAEIKYLLLVGSLYIGYLLYGKYIKI